MRGTRMDKYVCLTVALLCVPACAMAAMEVGSAATADREAKSLEATVTRADLLSDALPPLLSKFVQRSGADRCLDNLSAEELENLYAAEPDPEALLDLLQPNPKRWQTAGMEQVRLTAVVVPEDGAVGETLLVAGTEVLLADGTIIALGEEVPLGSVLEEGVVLNAGDTSILLEAETDDGILFSGQALRAGCATDCGITCPSGTFSCCNIVNGCAKCKCVKNGKSANCDSGGEPSTGCSVGQHKLADLEGG